MSPSSFQREADNSRATVAGAGVRPYTEEQSSHAVRWLVWRQQLDRRTLVGLLGRGLTIGRGDPNAGIAGSDNATFLVQTGDSAIRESLWRIPVEDFFHH